MSKEYFQHDFNARNSLQIQALIREFGAEGYGIFWAVVEVLHEKKNKVPLKQYVYAGIAEQIKTDAKKVETVIKFSIEEAELFVEKNGFISSTRVKRHLIKRLSISKTRAKVGKHGANVKQNLAKERKGKEIKGKEKKVNKSIIQEAGFGEHFLPLWEKWKTYKQDEHREAYQTTTAETAAVKFLNHLAGGDLLEAEQIINQSISNHWKGLFKLKSNGTHIKSPDNTERKLGTSAARNKASRDY